MPVRCKRAIPAVFSRYERCHNTLRSTDSTVATKDATTRCAVPTVQSLRKMPQHAAQYRQQRHMRNIANPSTSYEPAVYTTCLSTATISMCVFLHKRDSITLRQSDRCQHSGSASLSDCWHYSSYPWHERLTMDDASTLIIFNSNTVKRLSS
jgi:hypothetical protein